MLRCYLSLEIIVLFLEVHSFPWAALLENYSLLETDYLCEQLREQIFMPNGN